MVVLVLIFLFITAKKNPANEGDVFIDKKISQSSVNIIDNSNKDQISKKPEFNIESQSALARLIGEKSIFYQLNVNQRWPIASLTKLMTAVVALEKVGSIKEVKDLVRIMMIISDNKAADQLAEKLGREKFVAEMNAKAKALDMNQTSFFDASGLSYLNQSTVTDLYKLIAYIVQKQPQIFQWSREKEIKINGTRYNNINKFIGRPDFLGGKTGYTDEANGNLISIFAVSGKPLAIIVLGAADQVERFEQTKNLLEWIIQFYKP